MPEEQTGDFASPRPRHVRDRIEVFGSGVARVRPDLLEAQLAAETTGDDVAAVLEAAKIALRAMTEAARARGVVDDDVRTSDISVQTHHDSHGRPAGFRAWLGLTLTLRDLDAAGSDLADVVAAGGDAGRVQSVSLAVSDPATALDAAREAAFADARHQAEQLAALAGRALGGVRRVSTPSQGGWPRPAGFPLGAARQSASVPIEAGASSVSVTLQVRFDLI